MNETPVRVFLALLSIGAGAIHLVVIPEHLEEYVPFGLFFVLLAVFQLTWGVLALRSRRPLLVSGGLVNLFVIGVWVVSRSVGVPFGPHAGEAEDPGVLDGMATALEVLLVLGVAWLVTQGGRRHAAVGHLEGSA